jgi:hypothetical protein
MHRNLLHPAVARLRRDKCGGAGADRTGKTYIFELLYPNLKTQAVFTVPTRAVTMGGDTVPSLSTASWKAPNARISKALHPKNYGR